MVKDRPASAYISKLYHNFKTVSLEFMQAWTNPYTYDVRNNIYIVYGLIWGIPVILFSLYIDFKLNQYPVTMFSLRHAFLHHSFHHFSLMQPLVFAFIFGAMGTVRYEKKQYIDTIINFLEEEVEKKSRALLDSYTEAVLALAYAIEAKDPYTMGHCHRVKDMALKIAEQIETLTAIDRKDLEFACILHDIGKISVPGQILRKHEPLTSEEFEQIKTHSANGVRILQNISNFDRIREIILQHHERPDGNGYPNGTKDISILSAILTVADAFDAMTSNRPYRRSLGEQEALRQLQKHAGTQFEGSIVAILEKLIAAGIFRTHDESPERTVVEKPGG